MLYQKNTIGSKEIYRVFFNTITDLVFLFTTLLTAAVAQWVRASGRLGVRIPPATDLGRKNRLPNQLN